MLQVRESRVVPRPIDEVFSFVADFSRAPEWDPAVLDARRLDPWERPIAAGSRFHVEVLFVGRRTAMEYRVVEHVAPFGLVLEGLGRGVRARDDARFEDLGDSTRVTWTLELWLSGVGRLAEPFAGPFVRRLGRAALEGLVDRARMPLAR
ncbi:MAG: SRPBCC family protein [Alphaproteobacteria bacterium]|nr:SRPBCC family protein [Alphaproteobacteria bacterium]